ncbi:hypothetical protein FOA52_004493 [Chlamydomonas sp. UWO 241]|nr:hypothetical protein FOA52_004493 [Chlamydomonas sp. UWO 241]
MQGATSADADEYELSKRSLLGWTSSVLQLRLTRLEQCSNGAVYSQLLDAHNAPGLVHMHKVNFHARDEHEILPNYKVLQLACDQLGVAKVMPVTGLSRGSAADNLELLQWMFKYLKKSKVTDGYEPIARRALRKGSMPVDEVPLPSCICGKFGSPGPGTGKARLPSSLDILGGKHDVSHVVSRYKEGLVTPAEVRPQGSYQLSSPISLSPASSMGRHSYGSHQVLGDLSPRSGGGYGYSYSHASADFGTPETGDVGVGTDVVGSRTSDMGVGTDFGTLWSAEAAGASAQAGGDSHADASMGSRLGNDMGTSTGGRAGTSARLRDVMGPSTEPQLYAGSAQDHVGGRGTAAAVSCEEGERVPNSDGGGRAGDAAAAAVHGADLAYGEDEELRSSGGWGAGAGWRTASGGGGGNGGVAEADGYSEDKYGAGGGGAASGGGSSSGVADAHISGAAGAAWVAPIGDGGAGGDAEASTSEDEYRCRSGADWGASPGGSGGGGDVHQHATAAYGGEQAHSSGGWRAAAESGGGGGAESARGASYDGVDESVDWGVEANEHVGASGQPGPHSVDTHQASSAHTNQAYRDSGSVGAPHTNQSRSAAGVDGGVDGRGVDCDVDVIGVDGGVDGGGVDGRGVYSRGVDGGVDGRCVDDSVDAPPPAAPGPYWASGDDAAARATLDSWVDRGGAGDVDGDGAGGSEGGAGSGAGTGDSCGGVVDGSHGNGGSSGGAELSEQLSTPAAALVLAPTPSTATDAPATSGADGTSAAADVYAGAGPAPSASGGSGAGADAGAAEAPAGSSGGSARAVAGAGAGPAPTASDADGAVAGMGAPTSAAAAGSGGAGAGAGAASASDDSSAGTDVGAPTSAAAAASGGIGAGTATASASDRTRSNTAAGTGTGAATAGTGAATAGASDGSSAHTAAAPAAAGVGPGPGSATASGSVGAIAAAPDAVDRTAVAAGTGTATASGSDGAVAGGAGAGTAVDGDGEVTVAATSGAAGLRDKAAGIKPQLTLMPADMAHAHASPSGTPKGPVPALTADDAQVLDEALNAAHSAVEEASAVVPRLGALAAQTEEGGGGASPGGIGELMWRGKTRSLLGVTATLLEHAALLLSDVGHLWQCGQPEAVPTKRDIPGECAALAARLERLRTDFQAASAPIVARCGAPLTMDQVNEGACNRGGGGGSELAEALSSSGRSMDAAVKSVGRAQYALVQAIQRRSAALAAPFLDPAADALASGTAKKGSRSFKLGGELQLRKLRNGDVYRGFYVSGKKDGDGVYSFLNADVYEGEFGADRMDGVGVYSFSHEGRYEGEWAGAVYAGHGAETFSRGSTYYGEYSGGLRNGAGACRFFNGDYYEGGWVGGLREGRGMQQCTDDSNYVGDYVKGKRHGYGVYSFPNGDRYQGEYFDDLPHGHGVYVFASGQKYEGEWASGKKHGWSVYTVDNGQSFLGQWADSKPQWIQPIGKDGASVSDAGGEDVSVDMHGLAEDARVRAQDAARTAVSCAEQHWAIASPGSVAEALRSASSAAARAQAARRRSLGVAAQLNNACGRADSGGERW